MYIFAVLAWHVLISILNRRRGDDSSYNDKKDDDRDSDIDDDM